MAMKGRKPHVVPISPTLREHIDAAREELGSKRWLIPSPTVADKPFLSQSVGKVISRHLNLTDVRIHDMRLQVGTFLAAEGFGRIHK